MLIAIIVFIIVYLVLQLAVGISLKYTEQSNTYAKKYFIKLPD